MHRGKLICLILVLCITGVSAAGPDYSAMTGRVPGYYSGSGGEFTIIPSGGLEWVLGLYDGKASGVPGYNGNTNTFQSFCLETGEFVSAGWQNHDATLDSAARKGGNPVSDPLSIGSAWLYHEFQGGTLEGYDYDVCGNRAADAGILQKTFWYLEGEAGLPSNPKFLNLVTGLFSDPMADNNGAMPVGVLNMWVPGNVGTCYQQDMMVCIPAPGALFLGGIGAGLVCLLRRRKLV